MAFSIAGRRILVVAVIMIAAGMLSSCYTGNCCATFGDGQPSGKRSIRKQGHHSMQLIQIPVARADYEKATTPDDSSGKVMWKPRFSESTDVEKAEKTDDKPRQEYFSPSKFELVSQGDTIFADGILFPVYCSALDPSSATEIFDIITWLKKHRDLKMNIRCHVRNFGTTSGDKKLSVRRAKIIEKHLLAAGVSKKQFTCRGYGNQIAKYPPPQGAAQLLMMQMVDIIVKL